MFATERIELWLRVRATRVLGDKPPSNVLEGPGYLYRPGQLIVNNADLHLVAEQLKEVDAQLRPEFTRQFAEFKIPVSVYEVTSVPIPELVSRLRTTKEDGSPAPRLGPNHVFTGEPTYHGGPGGEPRPAAAAAEPDPRQISGDSFTVAALDTGVPKDLTALHPYLAARLVGEGDDIDGLYLNGDILDHEAGHGTFVSGILMQLTPWLQIDPEKVLDSAGIGDDVTVTLGLAKSKARLTNASLGGYTHDDMPPPALEAFLANRDPESVLVAAAGNNGSSRPFWPAAFKHVIAVAAVDSRRAPYQLAPFSNFGSWVDCCAPGVEIRSTYVDGEWRLDAAGGGDAVEAMKGWACWSGTSFAAPHVTAAIAARMKGTGLTPRQAALAMLGDATEYVQDAGFYIKPESDLNCPDC